ncbi:MAG: hypothetical protein ACETVR_00365 [Candidatus Bathyarchaeia archaeon]
MINWDEILARGVIRKTVTLHPLLDQYVRVTQASILHTGKDASYSSSLNYMLLMAVSLVAHQGIDEKTWERVSSFLEDEKSIEDLDLEDLKVRYEGTLNEKTFAHARELLRRAEEERRLSERILSAIPGFKGYKEKELRRESDRLIRNHLYRRLREAEDILKKFFQSLSDKRLYGSLEDMDRLVMEFDRVKARIDHASYGYTGFYDVIKIDEEDLEGMLYFDSNLVKAVEEISGRVKALKEVKPEEVEEVRKHLEAVRDGLGKLEETFNEREEKILGVK